MLSYKIKLIIDTSNIILQKKYKEDKILFIDTEQNVKTIEEVFIINIEIQNFWGIK